MLVDLAKLFPKLSSDIAMERLIIDTKQITNLIVDTCNKPEVYIIQLGKLEYKLLALDRDLESGMDGLSSICLCENLPLINEELIKAMNIKPPKSHFELLELCQDNLKIFEIKFGMADFQKEFNLN